MASLLAVASRSRISTTAVHRPAAGRQHQQAGFHAAGLQVDRVGRAGVRLDAKRLAVRRREDDHFAERRRRRKAAAASPPPRRSPPRSPGRPRPAAGRPVSTSSSCKSAKRRGAVRSRAASTGRRSPVGRISTSVQNSAAGVSMMQSAAAAGERQIGNRDDNPGRREVVGHRGCSTSASTRSMPRPSRTVMRDLIVGRPQRQAVGRIDGCSGIHRSPRRRQASTPWPTTRHGCGRRSRGWRFCGRVVERQLIFLAVPGEAAVADAVGKGKQDRDAAARRPAVAEQGRIGCRADRAPGPRAPPPSGSS